MHDTEQADLLPRNNKDSITDPWDKRVITWLNKYSRSIYSVAVVLGILSSVWYFAEKIIDSNTKNIELINSRNTKHIEFINSSSTRHIDLLNSQVERLDATIKHGFSETRKDFSEVRKEIQGVREEVKELHGEINYIRGHISRMKKIIQIELYIWTS